MAAIHWLTSINGNFTNVADWSDGVVPGKSDDAILDAVGSSYTVTSTADETVNSIQLASNAVLAITSGTIAAAIGTGIGANAGQIMITGPGALGVGGIFDNTGSITLNYAGGIDGSLIAAKNTTLTGGGAIVGGSFSGAVAGLTVINMDNTVSFNVVNVNLINKKQGIIGSFELGEEANLISVVNNGTIEPVNEFNRMYIGNCEISGTGVVSVGAGDGLQFDNGGTVVGQQLSIAAGGTIDLAADAVDYIGALNNAGILQIRSDGTEPELFLQGATTLSGGGAVELYGTIGGAGDMLINVDNTIEGAGNLGFGQIPIINQADGVIAAIENYFSSSLVIDCGAATLINQGMITAVAKSALTIISAVDNTGRITCGSKGNIILDRIVINDGVMSVGSGGHFVINGPVTGTGSAKITGGTLDLVSDFSQSVGFASGHFGTTSILELAHSQGYEGTISGFSTNAGAVLDLGDVGFKNRGEATYSGTSKGGVLTVTDGAHTASIKFKGDYLGATFVTSSDGHGGVTVVANSTDAPSAFPQAFISAMASLGAVAGGLLHTSDVGAVPRQSFLAPRLVQA